MRLYTVSTRVRGPLGQIGIDALAGVTVPRKAGVFQVEVSGVFCDCAGGGLQRRAKQKRRAAGCGSVSRAGTGDLRQPGKPYFDEMFSNHVLAIFESPA